MKSLVAVLILTSAIVFGALHHAGMAAGFAHQAHGSMEADFSCMIASCPASGSGVMQAMDCVNHCLAAASTGVPVPPVVPALFTIVFLLLFAGRSLFPVVEDRARRFTDIIGRLLLRQRLATVILRN